MAQAAQEQGGQDPSQPPTDPSQDPSQDQGDLTETQARIVRLEQVLVQRGVLNESDLAAIDGTDQSQGDPNAAPQGDPSQQGAPPPPPQ